MSRRPLPTEVAANQLETIEAILDRSGEREHVPLRRAFVQKRQPRGGPAALAEFVRPRRALALELYLLVHAIASKKPFDVALPAQVWARALGLHGGAATATVSKNLTWLEERKLIRSKPEGRVRRVFLLDEGMSGVRYRHPGVGKDRQGDYFQLPYDYWYGRFMNRLTLPAKAVLLIALSLQMRDHFVLPREQASSWYGISPDTIQRGLSELVHRGLVRYRLQYTKAPLSPRGFVVVRHYRLFPPFAHVTPLEAQEWLTTPSRDSR